MATRLWFEVEQFYDDYMALLEHVNVQNLTSLDLTHCYE